MAERDIVFRLARAVFYVSMFFVPLTAIRAVFGFPISDLGLFLALALSSASLVRWHARVPLVLIVASFLAIIATMLLSVSSLNPWQELSIGLRLAFVWVLWAFLASRVLITQAHVIRASAAFVLGGVLSSLVAFGQFVGVDVRPLFFAEVSDASARFIGLNGHPNGQGGTLAVAATLCFAAILYRIHRGPALAAASTILLGLMLCASISGTIATGLGFVVLVLRARKFRTILIAASIAAAATIGFRLVKVALPTLVTPFDRFDSAIGIGGVSTVDARAATVEYAWMRISEDPIIGAGFTNASSYNSETATHNMMLLAWYQGGLLMFLAVTIVCVAAIVVGWPRGSGALMEGFFAAVVAAVFFSQTGPSLYDRFVWLPVILLFVTRALASKTTESSTLMPGGRRRVPASMQRQLLQRNSWEGVPPAF